MSVAAGYEARIDEVAANLAQAGLRHVRVFDETGAITGVVDTADTLDALRWVEGVDAVEASRIVDTQPPGAPDG